MLLDTGVELIFGVSRLDPPALYWVVPLSQVHIRTHTITYCIIVDHGEQLPESKPDLGTIIRLNSEDIL